MSCSHKWVAGYKMCAVSLMQAALWDRTLVFLSPGGKDADTAREFDLVSKTFVDAAAGGFALPVASKSSARYRRRDELLVGCAFAPEQMTDSGYPRVVKSWTRGTRLEDATVVFEGEQADISVGQDCYYDRGVWHEMRYRSLTFYTLRQWLRTPDLSKSAAADDSPWALVPVPDDARVSTFGDALTIALRKDWAPGGGAGDRVYKVTFRPRDEAPGGGGRGCSPSDGYVSCTVTFRARGEAPPSP